MPDRPSHVYVVQGRGQRDYAECQAALDRVPATMTSLPFIGDAAELIDKTRDADGLIVAASPLPMDNVIATPHVAYFSSPAVAQVPWRCGEEVARVLKRERPLHVVNPEIYAPGAVRRVT